MFLIGDSPELNAVLILVTGAPAECQFELGPQFPTRYLGPRPICRPCKTTAVVSSRTLPFRAVAAHSPPVQTLFMRALIGILVAAAVAGAIYFYSLKRMPTTDAGTAPTQAISLTGVRMDLNSIAQAERNYIASNGKCASFAELSSSGTVNFASTGRSGYTYEVRCGEGNEFAVTARHASASTDPGVRYPILAVDQNMQVGEIQ